MPLGGGSSKMSEDGVATCNYLCQETTQRKYRNTLDSLKQSFFTSKFNVIYKRRDILFINMSECLGEEKRKDRSVNDYKLLETRSNVAHEESSRI